ncbi:hypothetical protein KP509_06G044900 [Ceratopteris richardii]|nr:hypothetical protein KP509_06G044900 [Ceratopteris richardii]
MGNASSHPSGMVNDEQSVNPHAVGKGNMFGNFSSQSSGHPGRHMASVVMRNNPPSSHMHGGSSRGTPNTHRAAVHVSSSDGSYGGARSAHNRGPGGVQGALGINMHSTPGRGMSSGLCANMPMQPKLAPLPVPQRQQGMGAMNVPAQSRHMGHHDSGTGPLPSGSSSFKRPASDHEAVPHKRPRIQGFSESARIFDVDTYRHQHEITVAGDNVPPPFMSFESANFPPQIARELYTAGFHAPTPIQAQSWPIALQGRDIIAVAKTGSGKTLGYLLPAFLHLGRIRVNRQLGPIVLVLSPTRELATQIQDEAVKFGKSSRISCTCVYGGAPKGPQLHSLDHGADIVIATPGRLNDFLEMRRVSLRQVSYLVLDEADRMLDMGFEPQIRKIVREIPPNRQTLMFTATWPKEVRKIAEDLLTHPAQVNIGNTDELVANKAITQYVEVVLPYEKQGKLERLLRSQEPGSKTIIFCSTKKMCDQLARSLGRVFRAAAIHGDKSQTERDHVLAQFKAGKYPILVATDVAARGLDIKDIRVVINFDFPTGVEDYVHRIGRTGRAGATGIAYSFFTEQDAKHAKELIGVLEGANQKVPRELRDFAASSFYPKRGGRWESKPAGIRDGHPGGFEGGFGHGSHVGGQVEGYPGRGGWLPSAGHNDRRDKPIDRFAGRGKFSRSSARNSYSDGRSLVHDVTRKYGVRETSHNHSYSSCSPNRGKDRGWSRSQSRSRSRSQSRSKSHSFDRHSDDRRWSPRKGQGSYRSRSPASKSPRHSSPPLIEKVNAETTIMDSIIGESKPSVEDGDAASREVNPSLAASIEPGLVTESVLATEKVIGSSQPVEKDTMIEQGVVSDTAGIVGNK